MDIAIYENKCIYTNNNKLVIKIMKWKSENTNDWNGYFIVGRCKYIYLGIWFNEGWSEETTFTARKVKQTNENTLAYWMHS